jgi:hypothetical protein
MLFDFQETTIESEKERNFYFKFFAGYYFNELVPGIESRIRDFCNILNDPLNRINDAGTEIELSPVTTHVTFDFHEYLINKGADRGELADILIVDEDKSLCIAIEVKWLENWNFEKDILANNKRIKTLEKTNRFKHVYQCLLIKESKHEHGKKKVNAAGSNYAKLSGQEEISVIVITWEDLLKNLEEPVVEKFFSNYMKSTKSTFRKELMSSGK